MRTRNFTLNEVIHRPQDITDGELYVYDIAKVAMGWLQAIRDAGCDNFSREIPLRITSGYRGQVYNRSIGSSDTSYHRWRLDPDGQVIFAVDFVPLGYPINVYFDWLKEASKGETYYHKRFSFIHASPYGPDEAWVQ